MTADWDGRCAWTRRRRYAMQRLIGLKDGFDVAFACDPDHDRHGIVTASARACCRPTTTWRWPWTTCSGTGTGWPAGARVGKTAVTSRMIERVAARLGAAVYEMPVGFKWFVDGSARWLAGLRGRGERRGVVPAARAAPSGPPTRTASLPRCSRRRSRRAAGRDPGELYRDLTAALGEPGLPARGCAGHRRAEGRPRVG